MDRIPRAGRGAVWFTVLVLFAILINYGMGEDMMIEERRQVFHSQLAGTWYTSDPEELEQEIDRYIAAADGEQLEGLIALVLPHAGYSYSGATAGFGVAQIGAMDFKRVVVLGPSHRYAMPNIVSVPSVTHYATPLGEVPLDTEFIEELQKESFVVSAPEAHRDEHSVQIEIPFLQRALKNFKLVPIVCGQLDLATAMRLGGRLRRMIDTDTLIVVSTDFTHYGKRFGYTPFTEDIAASIERLDMGAYRFMEEKDAKRFTEYVDKTGATICGRVPITVLLTMLSDDADWHRLKYDSSGRMTGDYANTVSYLAAAVTGDWTADESSAADRVPAPAELDVADQELLLRLARATLINYMANGKRATPSELGIEITPGMTQTMGAFVTLHKNGRLRGCIGEIVPRRALNKAVIDHAVNSALNDNRFPPVKAEEIEQLDIEISALTPPRSVDSPEDIEIGKHGVVLQKGLRASVFLPQVAPEQGWSLEETLGNLALKAGLPEDGWKEGASFEVFEAIVFGEK